MLFFSGFSLYGAMLLLPLYYQEVRGVTALTAGHHARPAGLGTLLCRGLAGPLTDRSAPARSPSPASSSSPPRTVPFAFAGAQSNSWLLALWLLVRGIGLGAATIPVMAAAFIGLDKDQIPTRAC